MNNTGIEPSAYDGELECAGKHVLVVEDEDLVRALVVMQVRSLGYRVTEAADGATGLEIVREREEIDLLLTDIVLPGSMSGQDLAKAARLIRPELRILYTSGYAGELARQGRTADPRVGLLAKPFRLKQLALHLSKMLDT
jgi:CheY-like chemotaxis protein